MFSFFNKNKYNQDIPLVNDIHSHLLPGIDDGSSSIEESIAILQQFESMGFKKAITTPHIISDLYPNTPQIIKEKLSELKNAILSSGLEIELEAAAEYYFDESLFEILSQKSELLTFGDRRFFLFETPFMNEPLNLKDLVFKLITSGFTPVLAHPERYAYLQANFKLAEELWEQGVLFQLNVGSLSGLYAPSVTRLAKKLINQKMVSFLGSDCHNLYHVGHYKKSLNKKLFQKALELPLLNQKL